MFELTEKELQKINSAYSFAEKIVSIIPVKRDDKKYKRFAYVTYIKNNREYSARVNLKVGRKSNVIPDYTLPITCIRCNGVKQRRLFDICQRKAKDPMCQKCQDEIMLSAISEIRINCNLCAKSFVAANRFKRFCDECRREGRASDEGLPSRVLL